MSSQGFALCFPAARGEGTGISPEMVRRCFFYFPAPHWKCLGPARRGRGCAAVMEHFASLRHLKGGNYYCDKGSRLVLEEGSAAPETANDKKRHPATKSLNSRLKSEQSEASASSFRRLQAPLEQAGMCLSQNGALVISAWAVPQQHCCAPPSRATLPFQDE